MKKPKSRRDKRQSVQKIQPEIRSREEMDKLKFSAYQMVVVQGYTQKKSAEMLQVSENTLSNWAKEGNWKELKEGRMQDYRSEVSNIKQIIRLTSQRRLEIEEEIGKAQESGDKDSEAALRIEANKLADAIAKWGKALRELDKENKYSLGELINMMDDMFSDLRQFDPELFERTIPFQQYYIRKKTNELG